MRNETDGPLAVRAQRRCGFQALLEFLQLPFIAAAGHRSGALVRKFVPKPHYWRIAQQRSAIWPCSPESRQTVNGPEAPDLAGSKRLDLPTGRRRSKLKMYFSSVVGLNVLSLGLKPQAYSYPAFAENQTGFGTRLRLLILTKGQIYCTITAVE